MDHQLEQQLCTNTGCRLEDLPEVMEDRDEWQERESGKSVQAPPHDDEEDIKLVHVEN